MKSIFLDRHGELRSGWRVSIFVALTAAFVMAILFPLQLLGMTSLLIQSIGTLVAVGCATWIVTRYINKKPFYAVGVALHPGLFREIGIGVLLGWMMMSGIMIVGLLLGYYHVVRLDLSIPAVAGVVAYSSAIFLIGAAFEEFMFRGYMLQSLMTGMTFLPAMGVTSFLFLVAHGANPNISIFGLVNIGLASMMLSFGYLKTRGLWFPIGLHFAWNFSQTTLYGFPTSGNEFTALKIFEVTVTGPDWITGGAFGPEGGFLATLAVVIGTVAILKWRSLAPPEGIITLDSIEDLLPHNGTPGGATP